MCSAYLSSATNETQSKDKSYFVWRKICWITRKELKAEISLISAVDGYMPKRRLIKDRMCISFSCLLDGLMIWVLMSTKI